MDFSTHFFASPQPAEKSPHRVNILSPRIQFKMVDVITWPPKEGFLLILKEILLLPLLFSPEFSLYFFLFDQPFLCSFLLSTPTTLHFFSKSSKHTFIIMYMLLYLLHRTIFTSLLYLSGFYRCLSWQTIVNISCNLSMKNTRKATLSNSKSKWKEEITFRV